MNTQLLTLLKRTPLSDEDIYNINIIFNALPSERQLHILNNWEKYVARLIAERKRLDAEQEFLLMQSLYQANTLLDAAIEQEKDKQKQQEATKRQINEELSAAIKYEEMKKWCIIHQACATAQSPE